MTSTTQLRDIAKGNLFKALADYDGDTKHQVIATAIEELVALNPTDSPTKNEPLLQGNWLLINAPNFPDRQQYKQHKYVYTLGRLAFNMFKPINLKVAIQEVMQPVFSTNQENEYTHDIVVKFKTIEDNIPELNGIIKNLAVCHPVDENTLQVKFTGGELIPANTDNLEQWLSIFGNNHSQSSVSIRDRFNSWFIRWMFGIKNPSEIDRQTGKRTFVMQKSPKGLLKILYLDEELRITKGNRGTVLVCQRQL
ncbi:MAG: PAP/fibrillin family protein [Xenococcaceae cyanobacterium MO_234.B1]|nr:PAP/fibrillin family protein [Xenococcaceae cyanobacterium MO_234.B1]